MGRTSAIAKAAAAAAFTILINSFGLQGQPLHTGMGVDQPDQASSSTASTVLTSESPKASPEHKAKAKAKDKGARLKSASCPKRASAETITDDGMSDNYDWDLIG